MENRENTQKSFFFSKGGRAEVLLRLTEMVGMKDSVSVLVGPPGSGKTNLCHTFAEKIDGEIDVVYFAYPPQSFEDFITLLADKLHCNVEESGGEQDEKSRRLHCIETITSSSQKSLFICDNAQGIYLATLERIIKFISECKDQEAEVHLILVGDSLVADACQSLSINEFSGSDVSVFTLNPLDKEETGLFYQGLLGRGAETGDLVELSAEVLERLYSKTDGNMKKINRIADRAAETDESEASFFSLLNDIEDEDRGTDKRLKKQVANKRKQHDKKRSRVLLLGGLILCVVVGGFYWWSSNELATVSNPDVAQSTTVVAPVEPEPLLVEKKQIPVVTDLPVAKEETVSVVIEKSALASAIKAETVLAKPNVAVVDETKVVEVTTEPLIVEKKEIAVVTDLPGAKEETVAVVKDESPLASVIKVEAPLIMADVEVVDETEVVEVTPDPLIVEKKEIPVVIDLPVTKKILVVQEPIKTEVAGIALEEKPPIIKSQIGKIITTTSSDIQLTSKQLYNKTVLAASEWTKTGKESWYTMQLMALTSESAETHLQKFLGQSNYRSVGDSLRVVRAGKKESPTLFVFYGEYSSADKAKEARELLPSFLLDQKPYIIPIATAIKKADS